MTDLPAATPGGLGLEKIHMTERAAMIAENPDGDVYKNERDLKSVLFKQEQMADEIAQKTAMVSDPDPLESLKDEYSVKDKRIRTRINELSTLYGTLRRTRPDGNSFYRAFAFGYLESLRHDVDELMNAQDIVRRAREDLVCLGYPLFSFEIFYDVVMISDSIVAYLRLITAAHIKLDSEYYTSFYKWDKKTLDAFCAREVEPMNIEADDIQMTALAVRFGIAIRVEYLEQQRVVEQTWGKPMERVRIRRDFVEGWDPRIHLLCRPGQFDILYKPSRDKHSGSATP
ncbi:unnamed protein product [Notodromas monacha]|uniref:OTU domain-containing protein n=1 Tax=Notodromas monacha TaxID=399045 RepID=A0A7R9BYQ4_9CRUS|nr:unnamed protein product [Notodromas monacha]CAG0923276.1 unnamed protein product [Notodromas monacha]